MKQIAIIHKSSGLSLFLLLVAMAGMVLFFPLKFGDGYTCMGHRSFFPAPVAKVNVASAHFHESINSPEHAPTNASHALLQAYLFPFGISWWISVLVLSVTFFQLKRRW